MLHSMELVGKLWFIDTRMEYFVPVKSDVYWAFNDMQKCLWHTIKCKRQDIKSYTQCDISHVTQLEKTYRKEKRTQK